jgi:BRCA1-associated protein
LYFEEKVMRVEEEFRDQVSRLEMRCRLSASEKEELEDKIEEQEKERKDREKKINQLHGRLTKVLTELQEEKELNKCLTGNQKLYKDKIDSIEAVMNESLKKKDQVREERERCWMSNVEVYRRYRN